MLRYFSKIRYKLATEIKVAKYLRYAIGEILLVVIGIVIALQINNWNELRKEQIKEIRFLTRLEADLNADIKNILSSVSANNNRKERAYFLLRTINQPQLVRDSSTYFIQSIEYAGYTHMPVISDNTFEEIKSTGMLSLIRNEEIRSALHNYYSWSTNSSQFDFIRQDIQLSYLHEQRGIFTADQQIKMGSFNTSDTYYGEEAIQAYSRMMNKPGFLEMIPIIIQSKTRTADHLEDILKKAKNLKSLIKSELKRT